MEGNQRIGRQEGGRLVHVRLVHIDCDHILGCLEGERALVLEDEPSDREDGGDAVGAVAPRPKEALHSSKKPS